MGEGKKDILLVKERLGQRYATDLFDEGLLLTKATHIY